MRPAVLALAFLAVNSAASAQELTPKLAPSALIALAKTSYPGETCWWDTVEANIGEIQSWEFTFRYEYEKEDGPDRSARLYQMPCSYGAYNLGSLFFYETEFDGLEPLHFAEPELDIAYADDDDEVVKSITVVGFASTAILVGATFDADTRTITSFSAWRGIADAASNGTWTFHDGRFVLTKFDVDASYDGERTPETVYSATGR